MSTAGQYLKEAASAIIRASVARRQEADDLRRQAEQKDRDRDQQVVKLQAEQSRLNASLTRPEIDTFERAELLRRVHDLEGEIVKVRDEFGRQKEKLLQEMRDKENNARDLQNKAAEFERDWANG
ncbi:MAG: hypothetical protein JWL85_562 [Candidatus Saccharibacteria bacterium]|nr:hypothetical protein [Candidatus Saccharibacteria bacterium]